MSTARTMSSTPPATTSAPPATGRLPALRLLHPESLDRALEALARPGAVACAGGTDLLVNLRRGIGAPECLVDLTGIAELQQLTVTDGHLRIGAGVTLARIASDPAIARHWPALAQAAAAVAAPQHRAAGTLGGNLCQDTRCLYYNQSHWWRQANGFCLKYRGEICHVAPKGNRCRAAYRGDLAPALIALGARVALAGPEGERDLPAEALFAEDGAAHLTLKPGELVTRVTLPPAPGPSAYGKMRLRGGIDFPLAGVAVALLPAEGGHRARLAVTGTNSRPLAVSLDALFAPDTDPEPALARLDKAVQRAVSPQRTTTTAAHYRRQAVAALAVRLTRELLAMPA